MSRASLEGGDLPGCPRCFQDQENSGERGGWRSSQGMALRRSSIINVVWKWLNWKKELVNSPPLENGRSLVFRLGSRDPGIPFSCPLSYEAALNALCVYDSGVKAACTSQVERVLLGLDLAKSYFMLEPQSCWVYGVRGVCVYVCVCVLYFCVSVLARTSAPFCVSAYIIRKTFKIQSSVLISPNLKSDWVKTTPLLWLASKRVGVL